MEEIQERIEPTALEEEMKISYIDYAMSVIVGRALPDVRDGLKPVQRRIIYTMKKMGLHPGRPFVKCARIIGDTMGKFHPHGDAAIYDALVRMAQDFSCRYPLITGQGNFGSLDGDPPAAFRYTEARMAPIAEELLRDIEKDTVDFVDNYDGSDSEPTVLPSAIPNLLINGSSGIAVGMATNIPPHNLGEVCDALMALIDDPEVTLEQLVKHLPAPDFPTGGALVGTAGIKQAYATGRGRAVIRSSMSIEELKAGRQAIIITEIPYQVNKSKLVEEIAHLVQRKKITSISELRDESSKEGVRIVIELKRGEFPQIVINQLIKHTSVQVNHSIIFLALVNNRPRYLPLRKILELYLDYRRQVVIRRSRYDLKRAEDRLHIVEGLKTACDHIDEVIKIIRSSKDVETARDRLRKAFTFSVAQANAILDMRLQKLTGLEISKLEEERKELTKLIKQLRALLASPAKIMKVIRKELEEVKKKYADVRRTRLIDIQEDLTIEDLVADDEMAISITHGGYIKRSPLSLYRSQHRGGKGLIGMNMKEEDWVEHLLLGTNHSHILFFSNKGRCYWLKVYEIPETGRASRGRPLVNLLQLQEGETIESMIPVRKFVKEDYLVMVTRKGQIIKNALSLYSNPRRSGVNAFKLVGDDELVEVKRTDGKKELVIGTRKGFAAHFPETEVRAMGRGVQGVRGIKLQEADEVIGLVACTKGCTLLSVCERGYGKRTKVSEYRLTRRGARGVINMRVTERNGSVVTLKDVEDDDEIIMITQHGKVLRTPVGNIRTIGRATQGVRLIGLDEKDRVISVAPIPRT